VRREEEAQYYSNARWYDPTLGRFITEDPARDGSNWFAYCRNNPLTYVDPTGLRTGEKDFETGNRPSEQLKAWGEERQRQIEFNKGVEYNAQSFVPDSEVSQPFENRLENYPTREGQLTYVHTGTDVVSKTKADVTSPAYMEVVSKDERRGTVTVRLVGQERQDTITHLAPSDVEDLDVGQTFAPGEKIAPYPDRQYGLSGGSQPHVHIQEVGVENGTARFLDPMTHKPGSMSEYPMKVTRLVREDGHWHQVTERDERVRPVRR